MSLLRSRIVPSFFSSRSEPIVMPRIFVLLIFILEMFFPLKGLIFFIRHYEFEGSSMYRGGGTPYLLIFERRHLQPLLQVCCLYISVSNHFDQHLDLLHHHHQLYLDLQPNHNLTVTLTSAKEAPPLHRLPPLPQLPPLPHYL